MNVPIWLLVLAPSVIATAFFVLGAVMASGAAADELADERQAYRGDFTNLNVKAKNDAISSYVRCSAALLATQRKLSAIRDLINKPETIRKGALSSILDGDNDVA